jgi:aspartate/methionine/tyrosine aminotransferase
MGVVYVAAEAARHGYVNGHPDWCNLGQGQPEEGPLKGAPGRIENIQLAPDDHAYGPVAGIQALRQTVADYYNRLYRADKSSKHSAANVAIAAGGRPALARVLAALGAVRIGYQTPDYTAYEDLLAYHAHRITPVWLRTSARDGFKVGSERLASTIAEERLGAWLFSNPGNPTGQVVDGEELRAYIDTAASGREPAY